MVASSRRSRSACWATHTAGRGSTSTCASARPREAMGTATTAGCRCACARGGVVVAEPLYRGSLREELRKLDEVALSLSENTRARCSGDVPVHEDRRFSVEGVSAVYVVPRSLARVCSETDMTTSYPCTKKRCPCIQRMRSPWGSTGWPRYGITIANTASLDIRTLPLRIPRTALDAVPWISLTRRFESTNTKPARQQRRAGFVFRGQSPARS